MYAALGVDDIDSLLQPPPPPPVPAPVDAGIENSGLLIGQPQQAFEPQNHQAHVDAHRSLFLTEVVKTNPQMQSLIIAHCMQHLQFMASQMAQEQMPPRDPTASAADAAADATGSARPAATGCRSDPNDH